MKKIKKAHYENKYLEIFSFIGIPCLLVLFMVFAIKNFTTVEEVIITKNSAEALYYEQKYDEAIEEYKSFQENESWPIWKVKMADLYSLKGETEQSNTLLKEAIVERDKIIKEEGYEKYQEKDLELIENMLFTFSLNQEYEDVILFGEEYINKYGGNKEIFNILFFAYIQNNNEYKAEKLLEIYPLNKENAYDIANYANMNMLINKWDVGIELLKDSWELDRNELKIYSVLNDIYLVNEYGLISTLKNKIENTNEEVYRIFLAKVYTLHKENANLALTLLEEINENDIYIDLIKYEASNILQNTNEAKSHLTNAIEKAKDINKESYLTYYLLSLKELKNEKYDEALAYAKKSINVTENNFESFGTLIPSILIAKDDFNTIEIYYREAMKKEIYNYKTIVNLAKYYTNYVYNYEQAKKYYKLALNINKEDSFSYKELAYLEINNENYEEAIKNIKEAIEIDDNVQEYYRILGTLYLNKGMNNEGIELIREAYLMNEKDGIALNNAAWYYVIVEKDILRSYENIKAAYEDMKVGLNEEDKSIIIENYTNIKAAYDEFIEDDTKEIDITGLKLIY